MSFFGVNVTNPFSSPVGQRIEQATDASLPSENWQLNMEICDIINETEDGPRDAIKAIKRRLNQAVGKNYTIVMYTLTVLETCVKNCGKRFHAVACTREFVQELVKLIGPKNEPPTAVQEKVLNLIQSWADTFKNQPHTQGVVQVYQELKSKGIEFPMTDLDAMAPIITPERSVPDATDAPGAVAAALSGQQRSVQHSSESAAVAAAAAACARQPIQPTEQQMLKLRGELDTVQRSMRVFSEMLAAYSNTTASEASNDKALAEDIELLIELYNTCTVMQERVVDLIGKLAHDELTAELLQINDEMNNLFLRYTRFMKNHRVTSSTPSALVAQAIGGSGGTPSAAALKKQMEAEASGGAGDGASSFAQAEALIDLSEADGEAAAGASALSMDAMNQRMGAIGLEDESSKSRRKDVKDEFEAFAQSRTTGSSDSTRNKKERRDDQDELDASKTDTKNSYVTSPEFERFLAERTAAVAAEVAGGAGAIGSSTGAIQRQHIDEK
ncbi:hypothetical protein TKK_0006947 [Trichogramma kaykai]|uniref:VHS domain-containing protein n=1 Tax=Trichogramma kaykai TaxID=54128 RepID=A0ABD2XA60_9HYME